MAQPRFIPNIEDLTVGTRPFGVSVDHSIISFSIRLPDSYKSNLPSVGHSFPRYSFDHEGDGIYSSEIYRLLITEDPGIPLSELTQKLSESLHASAKVSYPHTLPSQKKKQGKVAQNRWYDEECKEKKIQLQRDQILGLITHKQSKAIFRCLIRRKKREWATKLEDEIYKLFLSQDSKEAWKVFQEHSATASSISTEAWVEYATSLYDIRDQPPIHGPQVERPTTSTFFRTEMIKKAIDKLKTGKAQDHEGIVAEHFIHAKDTIADLIAFMFNRALCEGFPGSWSLATIIPILKSGDPNIPDNYRTIMVGHLLAKLYATVLEQELSRWAEKSNLRAVGQAGFRKKLSTLDHVFTLRAIIEEGRARGKKIYCTFVDFKKAFDTVPRAKLVQRLLALGTPDEIVWGIMALYGSVVGRVRTAEGLSQPIQSTIGVKQGCPLSPTLFGLYIDEMSEYLGQAGCWGAQLCGTWIPILLYADDIVLIADSAEGMQQQLATLHKFAQERSLTVNLKKTKTMIFNTTPQWIRKSAPSFQIGTEDVEYVESYTYLGVLFRGPKFDLKKAADTRMTRGQAALAGLERMCAQVQFQEPRTKLWLFDTLVTSVLLYGVQIWGPSLNRLGKQSTSEGWKSLERPLTSMISKMFRSKASVPQEILRAELAAAPIVIEALTKSVSFLHNTWALPRSRYARLALESSRQLALEGDETCWYAQMAGWLEEHGLRIDQLPPFQYSLEAPSLELTKQEINKIIRQDLIQNDVKRTWIEPAKEMGVKMAFYKEHFLDVTEDGFIVRPGYMDTHLSFGIRCAIGQIRTSSHQLEVETGRYRGIPPEQRICQVCHFEPETEEHYICRCTAYYEIRGRFHCLFKEGFGPLTQVMKYCDQRCLGLFLLEIKKHRADFLKNRETSKPQNTQRCMSDFFTHTGSSHGEGLKKALAKRGVVLERAVRLGKLKRPKLRGSSRHRRRVYKYFKRMIARHRARPPRFFNEGEMKKLAQRPMKEILK